MWRLPPTKQDILETASAAHQYFRTNHGPNGVLAVYYSALRWTRFRTGRAVLHLYEADTIQDMKKRTTRGQFPLCALYRIDGATVAQYRKTVESAIRIEEAPEERPERHGKA